MDLFLDYRDKTLDQKREDYLNHSVKMRVETYTSFLNSGQFLVGHFEQNSRSLTAFNSKKQLFLFRDLRACVASHMRFVDFANRGANAPSAYRKMPLGQEKMLAWFDVLPGIFQTFETMVDWTR